MKLKTEFHIGWTSVTSGYPYNEVLVTATTVLVGTDLKVGFASVRFWVPQQFGYKEFEGDEIKELLVGPEVWSRRGMIATKYEGAEAVQKLQEIKRNLVEESESQAKAKVEEILRTIND